MFKKFKLNNKQVELILYVLYYTLSYGWESCFGGYDKGDKRAEKRTDRYFEILESIINKLNVK
jgi:hypothetical protein